MKTNNKKTTKKRFIGVGVIFLILIMGLSIFYFINSADRTINKLTSSIENNDFKQYKETVNVHSALPSPNQESFQKIVTYNKQHPDFSEELATTLKNQLTGEKDKIAGLYPYQIKKIDSKFLPEYQIFIEPSYIEVSTKQDDVIAEYNNQSTTLNNQATLGPFEPGEYIIEFSKQYPFSKITDKKTVDFLSTSNTSPLNVNLEGEKINVYSEQTETKIFVNQADSNEYAASKDESKMFGPISKDNTLKVSGQKEYPFGLVKSDSIVITPETTKINVTPVAFSSNDKENIQAIVSCINSFSKEKLKAEIEHDAKFIKSASPKLLKSIKQDIQNSKEWKETVKGEILVSRLDFSNALLSQNSKGEYQLEIAASITKNYTAYTDTTILEKQKLKKSDYGYIYKLVFNESAAKWQVDTEEYDNSQYNKDYMKSARVVETRF